MGFASTERKEQIKALSLLFFGGTAFVNLIRSNLRDAKSGQIVTRHFAVSKKSADERDSWNIMTFACTTVVHFTLHGNYGVHYCANRVTTVVLIPLTPLLRTYLTVSLTGLAGVSGAIMCTI